MVSGDLRLVPFQPVKEGHEIDPTRCRWCLENYNQTCRIPRLLNCKHTVCTECVRETFHRIDGVVSSVRCPVCRWTTCIGIHLELEDTPVNKEVMEKMLEVKMDSDKKAICDLYEEWVQKLERLSPEERRPVAMAPSERRRPSPRRPNLTKAVKKLFSRKRMFLSGMIVLNKCKNRKYRSL